jgi:carboxymethylenebutenolidase
VGQIVEFPSNGHTIKGYLATPADGASGPGVIVIQEWWGLVDHIKDVAERFAREGFVALAPDLYDGASTREPDEAGKLMMALNMERVAKDLGGAIDRVVADPQCSSAGVGVVGYCMGGGLALLLATFRPDAVKAVAPYYGLIPWESARPDWSKLTAPVEGHYGEKDGYFGPGLVRALEEELRALGKDATLQVHPGVDHAFFNDTRPEVYDPEQAGQAFGSTVAFFRTHIS